MLYSRCKPNIRCDGLGSKWLLGRWSKIHFDGFELRQIRQSLLWLAPKKTKFILWEENPSKDLRSWPCSLELFLLLFQQRAQLRRHRISVHDGWRIASRFTVRLISHTCSSAIRLMQPHQANGSRTVSRSLTRFIELTSSNALRRMCQAASLARGRKTVYKFLTSHMEYMNKSANRDLLGVR